MITLNHLYRDLISLKNFSKEKDFENKQTLFIQIFTGVCEADFIDKLIHETLEVFPSAHIIGSTTDGEIINGLIYSNQTVFSFSLFEHTQVKTFQTKYHSSSYDIGLDLIEQIKPIADKKLFITFTEGLNVNGEDYLKAYEDKMPELIIGGGLAGDNAGFNETYVFTEKGITNGAVGAVLFGNQLYVNTHYNFSWERIGKKLTVTKSKKNRVYTIDGISATEIYGKYLGAAIKDLLPATGIEFPLIIPKGNLDIARAVLKQHDDGSLSFAGNIKEGEVVQFGYGNINSILSEAPHCARTLAQNPVQSIYIYSCMARKHLLGDGIATEIKPLQDMAPTAGFFTYGEFFHRETSKNELLNQTMTLISLSESTQKPFKNKIFPVQEHVNNAHTVTALSHLISVTSNELHNLNKNLENRVKEKTEALRQLNKNLEQRVLEKTSELEEQYTKVSQVAQTLMENEKFSSLGTLVAGVAHEINTPVGLSLTGITHLDYEIESLDENYKNKAMTERSFKEFIDHAKKITKSITTNLIKAASLVKSFKQVAVDQSSGEDRKFNLKEYTDEIMLSLHNKTKLTKHKYEIDISSSINIITNPGSISQIITNLILNAIMHAFDDIEVGIIKISAFINKDNELILTISDNGIGLSAQVKEKIFDPFFTTKRGQGGSGLGMNIIYNIVTHQLKGSISVYNNKDKGTSFMMTLPVALAS